METGPEGSGLVDGSQKAGIENVKAITKVFEKKNIVDNTDFRMEVQEGKEKYICNICGYEAEQAKAVKSHMSKKHREKPGEEEGDGEPKKLKEKDKSFEFNMDELDDFLIPDDKVEDVEEMLRLTENAGEQPVADTEDVDMTDEAEDEEMTIQKAKEKINCLEEYNNELIAKVKSMEEEVQTKNDLIDMGTAKINSLEMEKINKEAKVSKDIAKLQATFRSMKKELLELREAKGGMVEKDLKTKLKASTKAQETAELRVADMIKKNAEESNNRAKAEAEVIRSQKMIEHLEKLLEYEKGRGLEAGGPSARRMDDRVQTVGGRDDNIPEGWKSRQG